ncbi:MAG TPA: HipA family kinase [Anaerolineae bacterium]
MMRTLRAIRYVTPLREGGSLPAIVEASDGELYVMKFVGAGHGHKALTSELIAGEIARALSLNVPEIVLLELDENLGRSEGDPEIQALLKASIGLNLGLRYLPKAFAFDPLLKPPPHALVASSIVWFDAYVLNVDRTPRNANILLWQKNLWLIDHGSTLYFHYDWKDYLERARSPFPFIKDHVLLPFASELDHANESNRAWLSPDTLRGIVNQVPANWLGDNKQFADYDQERAAYTEFLTRRLDASAIFVEEAKNARGARI